jgi:hypothetical protein
VLLGTGQPIVKQEATTANHYNVTKQPPTPAIPMPANPHPAIEQNSPNYESDSGPNWSNWALVLVGMGGIGIGIYTLRAIAAQASIMRHQSTFIRRQTKASAKAAAAAERSIELQETLNQQWVQVNGWRRHGGGSHEQDPPRFRIAVDISNPTNNPLTIIGATITAKGQTRTFSAGTTLGPDETPIIIETHEVVLEAPEIAAYKAYKLPVIVTGEIVYRDIFGKDKIQSFGQLCVFGPNNHFQEMPFYQMRVGKAGE